MSEERKRRVRLIDFARSIDRTDWVAVSMMLDRVLLELEESPTTDEVKNLKDRAKAHEKSANRRHFMAWEKGHKAAPDALNPYHTGRQAEAMQKARKVRRENSPPLRGDS